MSKKIKLKLYVRGKTARFKKVIADVEQLCEEWFGDSSMLSVVDVQESPRFAQEAKVFMVPALIKEETPRQMFVGRFDHPQRLRGFFNQLASA